MRPAEERRHPPGPAGWEESWAFDFVAGDGSLGGFVRLTLRPAQRRCWYWAYVAGPGRPLVVVRDHDVELPRGRDLEVRSDGLWAQVICETPLDHWSAGLEAFAVSVDEPSLAAGEELGDPIPLGLDLEWEMAGDPAPLGGAGDGYGQPAAVHGDVLVGAARIPLDGTGSYSHRWGPPAWGDDGWWSMAARLGDGSSMAATAPGSATTWPVGGGPATGGEASLATRWDPAGRPTDADLVAGDLTRSVAPAAVAPVTVDGGVLVRALVGVDGDGHGWAEWRR